MKLGLIGGEDIKKYTIADIVWSNISALSGISFEFEIIPIKDFIHLCKFYWQFCDSTDFIGFNVALPWKSEILKLVNHPEGGENAVSAINVVYKNTDKINIANTDVIGIERALLDVVDITGKDILILGAGGAGFPTAEYLSTKYTCNVYLYDIKQIDFQPNRVNILKKYTDIANKKYDIVVNATTVGKYYFNKQPEHYSIPISIQDFAKILKDDSIIQEMNYFPYKSELLKYAEKVNLRTIPGINMLIYQALESFRLYTGVDFDKRTTSKLFDIVTDIAIKKENELF